MEGVYSSDYFAKLVLWLLDTDALTVQHLKRINVHHRTRRRNLHSRVKLRLTLVLAGESYPPTSPPGQILDVGAAHLSPSFPHSVASRELTPDGWAQVTRTAWALRPFRDYAPKLVVTSSTPCCVQTAERLRALTDDSQVEGRAMTIEQHPQAVICRELDGVDSAATDTGKDVSLARTVYTATEAIAAALKDVEEPDADDDSDMPLLPPVLLIANPAVVETLLSCINSGFPKDVRRKATNLGRLRGGDAVMLESPTLFRIVGDTEDEEYVKTPEELWVEGFTRNQWHVTQHIAGNGRTTWLPKEKRSSKKPSSKETKRLTPMREEWRRYCGEPLIYSDFEFERLCVRAGSDCVPLDKLEVSTLRPLIGSF